MRKKLLLGAFLVVVYLLHQDFWNWRKIEPLIFGFLPIGLAYHAGYSILASITMAVLVKFAWPAELDKTEAQLPESREGRES
ncbi:MAG: DUF3311 domain-containing protein [Verrucomicrobiae bacterium]|nr:DUF3311 domain-containing protein [Verrucomicrobiae bacterium]